MQIAFLLLKLNKILINIKASKTRLNKEYYGKYKSISSKCSKSTFGN